MHALGPAPPGIPSVSAIAVTVKPPLRYVYPQRLVAPIAGLSPLLLKARADVLSPRALDLKRAIEKKVGTAAPVKQAS